MGLESALQRVSELQAMLGYASSRAHGRSTPREAGTGFAAELARMQQQHGNDPPAPAGGQAAAMLMQATGSSAFMPVSATGAIAPGTVPGVGATAPGALSFPGLAGARMVALAQGELGVTEAPPGSNDGTRIREYRTAAGARETPGPWCAYFVSWLAQQAGAPIGPNGGGFGYVPTMEAWARSSGRFTTTSPQPGDIVVFDRPGHGIADHTGIVERVGADGTLHTIEGNTSDRVARRSYDLDSGTIRGYIRM